MMLHMDFSEKKSMRGQIAVITGAGSAEGIGFAVARRLHAAGVRVVITSTTDRIHARARNSTPAAKEFFPSLPISLSKPKFRDLSIRWSRAPAGSTFW